MLAAPKIHIPGIKFLPMRVSSRHTPIDKVSCVCVQSRRANTKTESIVKREQLYPALYRPAWRVEYLTALIKIRIESRRQCLAFHP